MKFIRRWLRKRGFVHRDHLPLTEFTISYHFPAEVGGQADPPFSITGTLRGGIKVYGDLYPLP